MEPTLNFLVEEHELIKSVINSFSRFLTKIETGVKINKDLLQDYVDFFAGFADKYHHAKEEKMLFPKMEKNGFTYSEGPLYVMMQEHNQGRTLITQLKEIAILNKYLSDKHRNSIIQAGKEYIELLSAHINKEDLVLYPMAEKHLQPQDFSLLQEEFNRFTELNIAEQEVFREIATRLNAI